MLVKFLIHAKTYLISGNVKKDVRDLLKMKYYYDFFPDFLTACTVADCQRQFVSTARQAAHSRAVDQKFPGKEATDKTRQKTRLVWW